MKGKLFDTSALINIIINKGSGTLRSLREQFILDLTIYEAGNTIWRLVNLERKITSAQACSLLDSFLRLAQYMQVLTIHDMEEGVKELAIQKDLTFYDASYLAVAEKNSFVLVTDDERLAKVATKHVKVIKSGDI
jgi:predicted nucleic acid-binding protein